MCKIVYREQKMKRGRSTSSHQVPNIDYCSPSSGYQNLSSAQIMSGNQHSSSSSSSSTSCSSAPVVISSLKKDNIHNPRANNNFKVVIRTRPPLQRELNNIGGPFQNVVLVDKDEKVITISENLQALMENSNGNEGSIDPNVFNANVPYAAAHTFTFDHVYDQFATQRKVYETTARGVVDSSLQGYNATIFAYGQTGTGKTYTMEGFNREDANTNLEDRGIIPRAIEQIFGHIQSHAGPRMRFLVRASYLQIYNETISDLLKAERNNLMIREDKRKGVYVEGLSEWVVRSPAEIYGLMERGGAVRATGSTKMNEISSRSHAVFIIIVEQSESYYVNEKGEEIAPEDMAKIIETSKHNLMTIHAQKTASANLTPHQKQEQITILQQQQQQQLLQSHVRQSFKVGKLNLVDLAGSERVRLSGATGQRLEESKKINQSLSALGNVIAALTDLKRRSHIPYRDSKLTRILEDSLGGN